MTMTRVTRRTALCLVGALGRLAAQIAGQPGAMRDARWREDLRVFARELPARHINAFARVPRSMFDSRAAPLRSARRELAEHDLVIGEVMLAELRRTLRTKLKLPDDRIAAVEAVLASVPSIPKPPEPADVSIRDPADRWILATAIAGDAAVLVTGDRDLLDARADSPTQFSIRASSGRFCATIRRCRSVRWTH